MKAFVLISLKEGTEKEFIKKLRSDEVVRNVYILFGEWDLMMEINTKSAEELGTFVMEKIRSRPDVKLTSSLIVAGQ